MQVVQTRLSQPGLTKGRSRPEAATVCPDWAHSIRPSVSLPGLTHARMVPAILRRRTLQKCRLCSLGETTDSNGFTTQQQSLSRFDSVGAALRDLAVGKFVVVLDNEDRENEGDLIIAADRVTPEAMHFMVEYTSGVVCIAMKGDDLDRLRLPLMVQSEENNESMYTAFTVTVDLKEGTTTGISAADRAMTIRALADPSSQPSDFRRPGHIFPLRYREGGVLVRPGHTEAAVDLSRLAGCYPAGVLCEIVNKADGSMARTPQLLEFAKQHDLKCITIDDLVKYILTHEGELQGVLPSSTPLPLASFQGHMLSSSAR